MPGSSSLEQTTLWAIKWSEPNTPIHQVFDESECMLPVGFLTPVIDVYIALFAVIIYRICFSLTKGLTEYILFTSGDVSYILSSKLWYYFFPISSSHFCIGICSSSASVRRSIIGSWVKTPSTFLCKHFLTKTRGLHEYFLHCCVLLEVVILITVGSRSYLIGKYIKWEETPPKCLEFENFFIWNRNNNDNLFSAGSENR